MDLPELAPVISTTLNDKITISFCNISFPFNFAYCNISITANLSFHGPIVQAHFLLEPDQAFLKKHEWQGYRKEKVADNWLKGSHPFLHCIPYPFLVT